MKLLLQKLHFADEAFNSEYKRLPFLDKELNYLALDGMGYFLYCTVTIIISALYLAICIPPSRY